MNSGYSCVRHQRVLWASLGSRGLSSRHVSSGRSPHATAKRLQLAYDTHDGVKVSYFSDCSSFLVPAVGRI